MINCGDKLNEETLLNTHKNNNKIKNIKNDSTKL